MIKGKRHFYLLASDKKGVFVRYPNSFAVKLNYDCFFGLTTVSSPSSVVLASLTLSSITDSTLSVVSQDETEKPSTIRVINVTSNFLICLLLSIIKWWKVTGF